MVASFPEFDYRTRRSQSNYKAAGCVPSVHIQSKPSKLKLNNSTLRPAATQDSADSTTVLRKLLSFHGSFSSNHSNRRAESLLEDPNRDSRPAAQIALLGDRASNFLGKKNSAAHMGDEPNAVLAASQNIDRKEFNLDSRQGNAGKSSEFASKTRRKWSSFKTARLHSSGQDSKLGTQNGYALFRRRGQCQTPRECQAAENVDSTRTAPKCSAGLHVEALSARGQDESQSLKCDLKEVANPTTNVKTEFTVQNSYLDAQVGDIGAQKCTPNPVDSSNVASSVTVQDVDGNNASCDRSSNGGREQANCENSRKVSSSATGVHNFTCSSENPLYASDNSSNNLRWSSTSCASTDTSGSNSTRRSSCESRTFIVPSSLSFTSHAKPHKVHDATWAAIHHLQLHNGGAPLSIGHFRLVRRVGHGDIGSVFLAHLKEKAVASPSDISCLFAIKVMDKDALSLRNKLHRMHMEKEILESVDHPFLPTLYAHFDSEHYSCLVMDYCPGGDLYALRQKQPGKRFGLLAARFYAAEVLLALEYLHMLGIVYRDLKPENVLVREDGHIMLTDFDLSLKCDVKPQLLKHPLLSSSSLLMSASLSSTLSKRRLMRSHSQSSTMSSSSTMSTFLHHGSTNGTMPVACSMDPIVSCLSLSNTNSRKAQHFQKHQASATALSNMVGSDASNASCMTGPLTSSFRDRSVVEPLPLSKQDVCCAESVALSEKSSDGEHAKVARSGTIAEYEKNDADHNNEGTERATTSGLGCQEDHMVFMELVAEPTQARSMSFVGTHEYLAPEIIAGHGHGSQVDWWTLGIFVYELLFGKTPFKGASNDQTLINIIRQQLRFPEMGEGEFEDARSLIEGLLVKDPRRRLGCTKGAAEIKQHPFFKGVNWALIRCTQPPEMPCKQLSRRQVNNPTSYHHIHRQIYQTAAKSLHHFDVF